MAGKDFALRATPAAAAVIERLRGTARRSYATFETELRKKGLQSRRLPAAGRRGEWLLGVLLQATGRDWRVITTFEPGIAIVVAVGRHDSRAFYAELSKTLAIGAAGRRREEKPACCGKGGWPSVGSAPGGRHG